MKIYIGTVTGLVVVAFAVMIGIAAAGIYSCVDCDLLRFQESKIAALSDVDTVVLGDSSIGYAFDAATFSELSERKTVNLALTGFNYGIGGAYALLKQLLERTQPKNVIVAITPQTYVYSIAQLEGLPVRGFLQASRRSPLDLFSVSPTVSKEAAKVIVRELFDRQFLSFGIGYLRGAPASPVPAIYSQYDYLVPSHEILDVTKIIESWGSIVPPDYDAIFAKLAQLCRQHRLNCLYVHSTLLKQTVERNRVFIAELSRRIEAGGVRLAASQPIQVPEQDIGNTINHIRPALRSVYTRKFYELLGPQLR